MKECIKHGRCWRKPSTQTITNIPTVICKCEYCGAVYRTTIDELIEVEDKTFFKCPECGHLELIQDSL